jgi:hypothetical protein
MSETFLSRWSRRKQEVRTSEPAPEDAVPPANAASDPADQTAIDGGSNEPPDSGAELSAEEVAALPSLEDLTADTDLSVFLRRGVPVLLRKAALRRMWVLDPKIRDFVCEAREYAYDWNTPGGVPGNGPLPSSEEILRMAARIVGGKANEAAQPDSDGAKDAMEAESQDRNQLSPHADASNVVPAPSPALGVEDPAGEASDHPTVSPPSLSTEFVAAGTVVPRGGTDEPLGPGSKRRHGGAIPL